MRRSNISDPSGRDRSNVTPRFPALAAWKIGLHSHQRSCVGGRVLAKRMLSGLVHRFNLDDVCSQTGQGGGGRRTGPPGGAVDDTNVGQGEPPAVGCGHPFWVRAAADPGGGALRRAIRSSRHVDRAPGQGRTVAATLPRCDTALAVGGTDRRVRYEDFGATNCSNSVMVEPLRRGPAGIRNNAAASRISSVERCVVKW